MKFRLIYSIILPIGSNCNSGVQQIFERASSPPHSNGPESRIRNATDSFLFSSIASLLQQWPNTLYRNGHNIVKGTIPVGTILYEL